MNIFRPLIAAAFLTVFASACGSSETSKGEVVDDGKAVASVDISPNQDTMSKGAPTQLHATVKYADGTTRDVTNEVVWNSSAPSVAAVSKEGVVTPLHTGLVNNTADYKGAKGDEHFIVKP